MNQREYLEAARIVASCRANRLPQVLALLRKAGLDVSEEEIREAYLATIKAPTLEDKLKKRRNEGEHKEWEPSENPAVLRLRDAYSEGASFIGLSRLTGIGRSTLYRYMYGTLNPSKAARENILANIQTAKSKAEAKRKEEAVIDRPFWEEEY